MRLNSLLAAATLVALTAATAQASSITYNDSFSLQLTELTNKQLRVGLFDTSVYIGQVLTSVSVTLSGTLTSSGTITNNAANPQSFSLATQAAMFQAVAAGPAALPGTVNMLTYVSLFNLPLTMSIGSQSYTNLPGLGGNAAFGPVTATSGTMSMLSSTNAGVLSQFVGTGQFGYDLSTLIQTVITGGGGNLNPSITTLADGALSVTYNYDAAPMSDVPEPGSLLLLSGGGLLVVLRRWRRR